MLLFVLGFGIHRFKPFLLPKEDSSKWVQLLASNSPLVESQRSETPFSLSLPPELSGASQIALGRKIDLNRATLYDLVALPGVGEKTAQTILADRKKNGPFKRPEDLMRVKGIKEKKFEKLKKFVMVEKARRK